MDEILIKFMQLKNSRLAVLLSGRWGSGKTYYIKNKFLPSIKEMNKYYISLFGVENIEDIYRQIVIQKFLKNKSEKFQKISGLLFSTAIKAGFDLLSKKAGMKINDPEINLSDILSLNNSVVVFDDLERVSPKVDLAALLGSINENFIEKDDIKVIFLADEKEIESEIFTKYKEKIIGFKVQLEYKLEDKINSIIGDYKDEKIADLLNENAGFICEIIRSIDLQNFRTIIYYFSILELIYSTKDVENSKSLKDLLYSVLVLVVEEKNNRLNDIKSDKDIPSYITKSKGDESITLSNTEKENIFNRYIISHVRKKYNYSFSYYYYPSIFNLIHFGKFDPSRLLKDLEEIEGFVEQNLKTELSKIVEALNGYMYMSNREFVEKYRRFVEIIETESTIFRFDEVVLVTRTLYYLNRKPQLRINPEKLVNWYIIPRAKNIDADKNNDFFSGLILSRLDREIGFISKENKELAALLDSKFKRLNKEYLYKNSLHAIEHQEFSELGSYDLRVYLNTAPIKEIYTMIRNLSNEDGKLSEFVESFERALKIPINSFEEFKKEEDTFIKLKGYLKKIEEELEYVDNLWINELILAVDKFTG